MALRDDTVEPSQTATHQGDRDTEEESEDEEEEEEENDEPEPQADEPSDAKGLLSPVARPRYRASGSAASREEDVRKKQQCVVRQL
ncbi:hypothetical protein BYT27DRAFT_7251536 [Phlegmacium glaucopus]|nr:hypothetical protein BYT27DRAFT_7251536 [Phlegmacium glaucopus]